MTNRVAAIQMASGPNLAANLEEAARLIAQAAAEGARLAVLPENFAFFGPDHELLTMREQEGHGDIQDFLATQARQHGIWLVGGTLPMDCGKADKVRSACLVYDDQGQQIARYDKLHLFDVTISDSTGERYQESATMEPGESVTVFDSPVGRIGLAICYDLRFPELFRCMLNQGAQLFAIVSAFTAATGKAHWEALNRARAIENLAYVISSNQGGYHVAERETWGNSMIIDPWGNILNRFERGAAVVIGEVDSEQQDDLRQRFPATEHRRIVCRSPEITNP